MKRPEKLRYFDFLDKIYRICKRHNWDYVEPINKVKAFGKILLSFTILNDTKHDDTMNKILNYNGINFHSLDKVSGRQLQKSYNLIVEWYYWYHWKNKKQL